jgi:hypothetical protein
MQDPGEPPRPEELPGNTPDELPALSCHRYRDRRFAGFGAGSQSGRTRDAAGDNVKLRFEMIA